MIGLSRIVWHEVTRNYHVGRLDDVAVVTVARHQKNRADGSKHDWRIEVLGSRHWNMTFKHHNPSDLESTKSAAEARTKWAIESLYRSLKAPRPARSPRETGEAE